MAKKNQCLNCAEPFEGPEFWSYILKLRSKTVHCVRCQTENYFVPGHSANTWIMRLIAAGIGLVVFAALTLLMLMAGYNEVTGTVRVRYGFIVLAAILSFGVTLFLLNLFTWKFAPLSTDRKHKSAADYE